MSGPIAIIPKNQREEIRIELSEFKGYDLINLRVWAQPRNGDGERIPTKAGIACKVALLPELIRALQSAETEARGLGLLP
jgi:Transcriptional Coactivator p15 (PC4)